MKRRSFLKFLSIIAFIPILGYGKNEGVVVDKRYITVTSHPFSRSDLFVDYVNGDDNYPGTRNNPFKTVERAIDAARFGDTIFLQPARLADGCWTYSSN